MKLAVLACGCALMVSLGCASKGKGKFLPPPGAEPIAKTDSSKAAPTEKDKPIIAPDTTLAGQVVVYNNDGRFVVLKFSNGTMPAVAQRLSVFRKDLKVGEVQITGPTQGNNIVADLTTGEAQAGDQVRER